MGVGCHMGHVELDLGFRSLGFDSMTLLKPGLGLGVVELVGINVERSRVEAVIQYQ